MVSFKQPEGEIVIWDFPARQNGKQGKQNKPSTVLLVLIYNNSVGVRATAEFGPKCCFVWENGLCITDQIFASVSIEHVN